MTEDWPFVALILASPFVFLLSHYAIYEARRIEECSINKDFIGERYEIRYKRPIDFDYVIESHFGPAGGSKKLYQIKNENDLSGLKYHEITVRLKLIGAVEQRTGENALTIHFINCRLDSFPNVVPATTSAEQRPISGTPN